MLRGIPEIIGSELLKALADMGHGDILVLADHYYPPYSKSPHAVSVQAKGTTVPQMLDAILKLFPLDSEYAEHSVLYMIPDADSGVKMEKNQVWDDVKVAVASNGYDVSTVGTVERSKFYDMAGRAFCTVCTSETQPYGCVIIQKGVK